jgi:hypothetical protein
LSTFNAAWTHFLPTWQASTLEHLFYFDNDRPV